MSDDARPRAITARDLGAATLAGLLFLLATIRFGELASPDQLDPSWRMVLTWASTHGLRWGSDIAFTYGPLSVLYPLATYDPVHHAAFVAAQIVLAGAAAFIFGSAWCVVRRPERVVLATAVLLGASELTADPVWLATPVLALRAMHAHAAAGRGRLLWALVVVAATYAATILLIKMSTLLLITAWWLVAAVVLYLGRMRRHAATWLLLVPLACVALWTASGQRPGDLPAFVAIVLEISRGYTSAMSAFPLPRVDLYGLAVAGGCAAAGLWAAWCARRDVARLACIALCGLALFVAWRAGFTRADAHVAIFATTAWLVLPLLGSMPDAPAPSLRIACVALVAATLPLVERSFHPGVGHSLGELATASLSSIRDNALRLVHPLSNVPVLDAALAQERARVSLPQTRDVVGTRSIDLVGTQQGVAVFNDFAYRPAPVIQGYTAFTPRLQQLNAGAYSGLQRTNFVLMAYSPIDGNLPTSENALAFLTLYRNYHPVLLEKSYLLLEKDVNSGPPQLPPPETGWHRTTWNAWNDLPTRADAVTVIAVRSELGVVGKAAATLLREPGQYIELELADGTIQRFRLVRGAAPAGFLVSPPVQSLTDYVRLFAGDDLPAVRRFRMLPQSDRLRPLFADDIEWRVEQVPRRPRTPLAPAMIEALYPGFSHLPHDQSASVYTLDEQGHRVLFMHSPARLRFRPGAGAWMVSGEVGLLMDAFAPAKCPGGDGVEVRVAGDTGAAHSYRYDPFADPTLRPARRFELGPVNVGENGVLRLDIDPGPAGSSACDWSYVRGVILRPVANGSAVATP